MPPDVPLAAAVAPRAVRGPAFRAGRGLALLGGFFAYGLSLSALYATTGVGVPCPFRALTGWQCPLCGGTRLGSALLHGDVATAFTDNPVVLIGLIVLGVLGVAWTVELLGGPALRPPATVQAQLRRISPTLWLVVGLGLAVVYTVLRNVL